MNMIGGPVQHDGTDDAVWRRPKKQPAMNCPYCATAACIRSSEEITPTLRRLYYACPNLRCGATWSASLQVENTISPSALSDAYRKPPVSDAKPPGHDFGQMSMLDILGKPTG